VRGRNSSPEKQTAGRRSGAGTKEGKVKEGRSLRDSVRLYPLFTWERGKDKRASTGVTFSKAWRGLVEKNREFTVILVVRGLLWTEKSPKKSGEKREEPHRTARACA